MPSLIIPFRNSAKSRLHNLLAVEAFYFQHFPHWQVIIVEQDGKPSLKANQFKGTPTIIFANNPDLFNKSWAINIGYQHTDKEILVIADADLIVAPNDLKHSIQAIKQELEMVRPFRQLIDLDQPQTQRFIATGACPDQPVESQGYDRHYLGESLCLAGGLFIIKSDFFDRLNGFDERFEGWGGEDDAFSIAVNAATNKSAIYKRGVAWHLWHPRSGVNQSKYYQQNCRLLQAYQDMNSKGDKRLQRQSNIEIGRLDKYQRPIKRE